VKGFVDNLLYVNLDGERGTEIRGAVYNSKECQTTG
jgi:hypothetical protein